MEPGKPDAQEFEYVRHGTQALIANFEVATGKSISPTVGETRTGKDFVAHIRATVEADPYSGPLCQDSLLPNLRW
ncbi:MAG: hypothetical protein ACOYMG_27025 [Candidatus Methylumidiphilus sp.]